MITFDSSRFVALDETSQGAVFSPLKGRGEAHVFTLPSAERPGVDVRDSVFMDSDGKARAACGGAYKVGNLVPGAGKRVMCGQCTTWLESEQFGTERERTLSVWSESNPAGDTGSEIPADDVPDTSMVCAGGGSLPVEGTREKGADGSVTGVCVECGERVPVARVANGRVRPHEAKGEAAPVVDKSNKREMEKAITAERERLARQKAKRAEKVNTPAPVSESAPVTEKDAPAKSEVREIPAPFKIVHRGREIDPVARETDGKCAYEITEDGVVDLVTVHGRNRMHPVMGSRSRGLNGAETGTCPVCRTHVPLTGSGYIPTHRPGGVTPGRPVLTQKKLPVVEKGTAVADMAKVREREAYAWVDENGDAVPEENVEQHVHDGGTATLVPVVPTAPDAGAAVGQRGHGMSDGVAMTPGNLPPVQPQKGWSAAAGTMALPVGRDKPDPEVVNVVMHGGKFGYLSEADYRLLDRSGQRKYWRNIAVMEKRAATAQAAVRAKREALGESISPERRKAARKSAKVGKSVSGTVAGKVYHKKAD